MSDLKTKTCLQEGCPFSTTGECQDGFNPAEECPHLVDRPPAGPERNVAESAESSMPEPEPVEQTVYVDLPSGDVLRLGDVQRIRPASIPRMVVLAGPPDAGKTTIITEIYDAFQLGRFDEHMFAESSTLPAFEERCFLNRPESGAENPDTEHTQPRVEPEFLHLRIAKVATPSQHLDLLFGDISGEDYERVRNNAAALQTMDHLRFADHVLLVVDGASLCDGRRHSAGLAAGQLLERFATDTTIPKDAQLHLVVSKMDIVEAHEAVPRAARQLEILADSVGDRFADVRQHFIAARPLAGVPEAGTGLEALLATWVGYGRPLPTEGT